MHLMHDLRLVLRSIGDCLSALQRRSAPPSLPPEIDQAHHLLEIGHELVDEVLVSRTLRAVAPHVDLNAVLRDLAPTLATIAGPGIDVRLRLAADVDRVYGQRADVERILLNIVHNAVAAMPSGGALTIDTEVIHDAADTADSRDRLRLMVRDNGRGVPEDVVRAALDPMAKPSLDGRGFGLACVAMMVTRLGGRLAIEGHYDRGTLITIRLPLADHPGAP